MTPTLDLALTTARLGLATLRLQRKAPRQRPDPAEPNTFDLPDGRPIAERLRAFFRDQERTILANLPATGTAPIPDDLSVTDWTSEMTAAMTPLIRPYWEESGRRTTAGLGLDPKVWEVTSPHLRDKIRDQSFFFCQSTNESTSLKLDAAHAELRRQLEEGIADRGETLGQLRERVQAIFTEAKDSRALAIAATEASRAANGASLEAAKQSGVARSKRLLLSSDSCPICKRVKASEPEGGWPLDEDMATIGDHPYYSKIPNPPIHVHCQCTIIYELNESALAEGPKLPEGVAPEDVVGAELPEYGPSRAVVSHPGYSESAVLDAARETFGREATLADVASAVGAADDATVLVQPRPGGRLDVAVNSPDYDAARTIWRSGGELVVVNESFNVNEDRQGRGLGAAVFGRQVEQAARLGVIRLETVAAGERGGKENGYITWPKFGYDGEIPHSVRGLIDAGELTLPPGHESAETVGDLMTTKEGRGWWATHGKTFDAIFDLTPGGRSMRVWDAYRREKAKKEKSKAK